MSGAGFPCGWSRSPEGIGLGVDLLEGGAMYMAWGWGGGAGAYSLEGRVESYLTRQSRIFNWEKVSVIYGIGENICTPCIR